MGNQSNGDNHFKPHLTQTGEAPWGGGGGTLIFSYIRTLGPFFGGQMFEI